MPQLHCRQRSWGGLWPVPALRYYGFGEHSGTYVRTGNPPLTGACCLVWPNPIHQKAADSPLATSGGRDAASFWGQGICLFGCRYRLLSARMDASVVSASLAPWSWGLLVPGYSDGYWSRVPEHGGRLNFVIQNKKLNKKRRRRRVLCRVLQFLLRAC